MGAGERGWGRAGDGGRWRRFYCAHVKIRGFIIAFPYDEDHSSILAAATVFRLGGMRISQLVPGEKTDDWA